MPAAPSTETPPPTRARIAWARWLRASIVTPPWLPARWTHPFVGYLVALLAEAAATWAGVPLSQLAPGFGFRGLLGLLVVALVALTWGAGPSVLATVVGALLLGFILPLPATARTPDEFGSGLGVVVFGLVGLVVSLSASRTAQAHQEAHAASTRLAALNSVAAVVIGAPNFGSLCDRALVTLAEVLALDAAWLRVYDPTAPPVRALRLVAWYGLPHESLIEAVPLGSGLSGQAALRQTLLHVTRLDETPTAARDTIEVARRTGLEARLNVAMVAHEQLLGTLGVGLRRPHVWTEDEIRLLQTVANQVAAALEAEQLRSAAAAATAAREADHLKSALLSTVSHELRTPLGAIKGFASGLLAYGDRLTEAERTDSLYLIDEAADRLTELIDNLLELQRAAEGRLVVMQEPVDLATVVRLVLDELRPRANWHTLTLEVASPLPLVQGDARRLRQVVQNLVENAIKYSPAGGRITAQLRCAVGVVELRVRDEGLGLAAEQLERVFERFHRVDNSSTRTIGGTGLGLAIVKELVVAQGGQVWAESAGEGQGSTFVVRLPGAEAGTDMGRGAEPQPAC